MVVVVIIAVVMTGVGLSLGATSRAKLRSSCFQLVSGIRYAYSNAVTKGMTTRVVLDFDKKTFHLEETSGRVVLNREDETGEGLNREGFDPDAGIVPGGSGMLDKAMKTIESNEPSGLDNVMGSADSPLGGMGQLGDVMGLLGGGTGMEGGVITDPFLRSMQLGTGGLPIGYTRPKFKKLDGKRGEVRELQGDSKFIVVFSPHAPLPLEEGRAFVYFFPLGITEHTIIQISDGKDRIYSVVVHPLTGQAEVINEPVEPEEDLDELQEAEE